MDAIKNDKQLFFNQVKGTICEVEKGEFFSSCTLDVGHENIRKVNFVCKSQDFNKILDGRDLGVKVCVKYYIVSRKKGSRWYTSANLLSMETL
jgi:hypothetical protein